MIKGNATVNNFPTMRLLDVGYLRELIRAHVAGEVSLAMLGEQDPEDWPTIEFLAKQGRERLEAYLNSGALDARD